MDQLGAAFRCSHLVPLDEVNLFLKASAARRLVRA